MTKELLKTENYIISYLDILGGKNLIENDVNNECLNKINKLYKYTLTLLKKNNENESKKFFIKIFSDNILIALKTSNKIDDRRHSLLKIRDIVIDYTEKAIKLGFLIRGAITEGEFFSNDILVFGKALVEAVEMENKLAIYPRIIVKEEIVGLLSEKYFHKCNDGLYMVNNYNVSDGQGKFVHEDYKTTLLKKVENLKKTKGDEIILQKLNWALSLYNLYHNEEEI